MSNPPCRHIRRHQHRPLLPLEPIQVPQPLPLLHLRVQRVARQPQQTQQRRQPPHTADSVDKDDEALIRVLKGEGVGPYVLVGGEAGQGELGEGADDALIGRQVHHQRLTRHATQPRQLRHHSLPLLPPSRPPPLRPRLLLTPHVATRLLRQRQGGGEEEALQLGHPTSLPLHLRPPLVDCRHDLLHLSEVTPLHHAVRLIQHQPP